MQRKTASPTDSLQIGAESEKLLAPSDEDQPADVEAILAERGDIWWSTNDADSLAQICDRLSVAQLRAWPSVARWRALAGLLLERSDTFACLEAAFDGHSAKGQADEALADVHVALVYSLIDGGAIDGLTTWIQRLKDRPQAIKTRLADMDFWTACGDIAAVVFDNSEHSEVAAQVDWLHKELRPLQNRLRPNERLIAALVLVNFHLNTRAYEKFDLIANTVGSPETELGASPLIRARWLHMLGWVYYQTGSHLQSDQTWQKALEIASHHSLHQLHLQASLALLRLLIDRGRLEEAQKIESQIQLVWGPGREIQVMAAKQLKARLQLMRGLPVQALSTLKEALTIAEEAKLSRPDLGSCLTDLAQILVATGETKAASDLLEQLATENAGRDAEIFRTLSELLQAAVNLDSPSAKALLSSGLRRAREVRYTMFFRLLPPLAAQICAAALRGGVEEQFALEVIRSRNLPAPASPGSEWPWDVYVTLFGEFDLRLQGNHGAHHRGRKAQKKPLELLSLIACRSSMTIPTDAAADALWPGAEGDAAAKSLEITIKRLRELFGAGGHEFLRVRNGHISLDATRVSSDVAEMRELCRQLDSISIVDDQAAEAILKVVGRVVGLAYEPLLSQTAEAWTVLERRRHQRTMDSMSRMAVSLMARAGASPTHIDQLNALLLKIDTHA